MAQYRKRPVIINAWQWDSHDSNIALSILANMQGLAEYSHLADGDLLIRTLEGNMRVGHGDWVIRGVNDEFYPCKPDIFEKTYERVP